MTRETTTRSEAETAAVAHDLAARLDAGFVVLLYGELGAGKTAFVRGLAEGLGVQPDEVSSPTFTLVQEYRGGRLTLVHADLYRLDNPREFDDLGLDEIGADGVIAIEWAEKLPPGSLRAGGTTQTVSVHIAMDTGEGDVRTIRIATPTGSSGLPW
jgi:tRNA threonylcarbamoyladenosine biosynthesis protein TsaE